MRKLLLIGLMLFFLTLNANAAQCTGTQHITNNCDNELVEETCLISFINASMVGGVPINYTMCIWNTTNGCLEGSDSCDYDLWADSSSSSSALSTTSSSISSYYSSSSSKASTTSSSIYASTTSSSSSSSRYASTSSSALSSSSSSSSSSMPGTAGQSFIEIGDTLGSFAILFDGLTAFVISIIPFLVLIGALGIVLGIIAALLITIKARIRNT